MASINVICLLFSECTYKNRYMQAMDCGVFLWYGTTLNILRQALDSQFNNAVQKCLTSTNLMAVRI